MINLYNPFRLVSYSDKKKMYQTSLMTHLIICSGSRIRTNDLRVMSPTSYLCSIPHYCFNVAKLHFFSDIAKLFEHLFQKKFTSLWFTIAYFYYIRGIYIAIFDAKQLFEDSFIRFLTLIYQKKAAKPCIFVNIKWFRHFPA